MDNTTSIEVQIVDLHHSVAEHDRRLGEVEKKQNTILDLTLSVKELSINMKNMLDEQKRQGKRLDELEKEPGETAKYLKRTVISAVASGLIGAILGAVLALILK